MNIKKISINLEVFFIVSTQSCASSKKDLTEFEPPLTLHNTVMKPNGVTSHEWKMMFEGERRSIRKEKEQLNKYIELFTKYFQGCSRECKVLRGNRFNC